MRNGKLAVIIALAMISMQCTIGSSIETIKDGSAKDISIASISSTEPRVSLDFEEAALKDVLKAFSRQTGINFIANESIEGKKVTIFLSNVSIPDALDSILDSNDLFYERQGSNVYLIKPSGREGARTLTRVFNLNYLQVYKMAVTEGTSTSTSNITIIGEPAIAAAGSTATSTPQQQQSQSGSTGSDANEPKNIVGIIKELMSKNGKIVADRRNNCLIITDIPDVFPAIEKTLEALDVEPVQIMIQAEIVETTTNALKRLGIEYGSESQLTKITYTGSSSTSGGSTNTTNPTFPTPFPFTENFIKDAYGTNLASSGLFKYGTITIANTEIVLKALAQDEDTKYLSRPRIMTINNEPAVIKVSANTAIGTTSSSITQTGQTISTAERSETGIVLRVTPQVNNMGDIFMYIEPSVSRAKASVFFTTQFMDPSYRSAASTVMVRDGETVVVGGLVETNNFKTTRKIPILGDIPIIGEPFKSNYRQVQDTELLIFITPHVVQKRDFEYITPQQLSVQELMMQATLSKYIEKNRRSEEQRASRKPGLLGFFGKKSSVAATGAKSTPIIAETRDVEINKAIQKYASVR